MLRTSWHQSARIHLRPHLPPSLQTAQIELSLFLRHVCQRGKQVRQHVNCVNFFHTRSLSSGPLSSSTHLQQLFTYFMMPTESKHIKCKCKRKQLSSINLRLPPSSDSTLMFQKSVHFRGWSGSAKVLGKLPVPGRSTNLDYSRARAYCACSRCGWRLFGHCSLTYHFSLLSSSLWETARYRLKNCLKGPLSPNQPIKQRPF